jgi:hypothetical protein
VFYYFPCEPGTKQPAFKGWQAMSSADPVVVQRWLDDGYNLALDCGKSDITVVDYDPGSQRIELPDTFERPTPRGGSHVYLAGACRGAGRKNLLGPHVDTRSTGGYVMVEPSVIDARSGKPPSDWGTYGPGNGKLLARVPGWIVDKLKPIEATHASAIDELDLPHNVNRARLWMESADAALSDDGAFQFACYCLDLGLSTATALDLMVSTGWLERCNMPFTVDEQLAWMATKLENAGEYMQNATGSKAISSDPLARFAGAEAFDVAQEPAPPAKGFKIHDEDEQDTWDDPSWLVPHLLPDDSLVMLYGGKGTFKSFLALDAALHIASARPGWGATFDERRSVVYCAGEGPTSVGKFRRPAWRAAYPDVEGKVPFYLIKDPEFPKARSEDSIKRFVEGVRALRPAVVVIDTLHVFMAGLSEIKDDDCSLAVEALKFIKRELGCIVVVIHHAGKNAEQGARGHSSLTADMDVVHEAIGHQTSKAVALHNRYQKDADERQEPWCFEGRPAKRSLVFHPITLAEYKNLTAEADQGTSLVTVARALLQGGAIGEEKAITTHNLASQLYQGPSDESPELTIANREKLVKQLNTAARRSLSVYAERRKDGFYWSVPA